MKTLGVGIIGYGRVGPGHVTAVEAAPETQLVCLAEVREERRQAAAAQFGGETVSNYHDLLHRDDVQVVVVGLPHDLHEEACVAAAAAGKHIFVEKPMAMDVGECDRILAAVARAGVKLMVGHSQHYSPHLQAAREIIQDGIIGQVVFTKVDWYKPLAPEGRPPWGMVRARGGGMLQMNGAHMIDAVRWLVDRPIVAVKGRVGNDIYGLAADDSFIGLLAFDDGRQATIQHAAYRYGVEHYQQDVIGTEGMVKVASYPPTRGCWLANEGQWEAVEPELGVYGMAGEISDFAQAVLNDTAPPITGAYGREIVAVMTALEESTRTGREVRL